MPESRHRKVNRARKRPRVASSNPNAVHKPAPAGDRNRKIITIVIIAAVAVAVVAYLVTSRRDSNDITQTVYETTTDSGLKIHDVTVGTGETPKPNQRVVVHYIGWLENGKEFNNSRKLGPPAEFNMSQLIKGWTEGLSTMKVGGKRRLWVPSQLAYGKTGSPPNIPPNANLTFELELLGIK